jgi:hypothetical protein
MSISPAPPLQVRVVVLIYNPVIEREGGRRLHDVLGWNNPDVLTARYIDDVRQASHGEVNYAVVERIELNRYPTKIDGFRYTDEIFLRSWRSRSGFHQPDQADYPRMLRDADFQRKVEANLADELWIFGFPYAGFFESCMGGRGAIWCNGPVIPGSESVSRRFCVMGFNYERGVGEMLENLGHRAENIMEHVFRDVPDAPARSWADADARMPEDGGQKTGDGKQKRGRGGFLSAVFRPPSSGDRSPVTVDLAGNLWRQFIRYDKAFPGAAQCGNVHFAPSSQSDYDWGNRKSVPTNADDWLNYPDFQGAVRVQNASAWGNGDIRAHHIWWMQRFPHVAGQTPSGKPNNWWRAIAGLEF